MDSNQASSKPGGAQNMVSAGETLGIASVNKEFKLLDKGLMGLLRTTLLLEKSWKNIHTYASKASGFFGVSGRGGGSGGSSIGMGQMPSMPPLSSGAKIGIATGATVAAGGFLASMAPNTMQAVTQRMAAETAAGISGMSPRSMITQANKIVARQGMGATSIYSPTMAGVSMLYQGGAAFGSATSKRVLGATPGLSAITGGSNEQVAGAYSAFNGNNMLSYGIRTRDSKGEMRPPYQIINELWNFLYRGKKVTKAQVAIVFNPGSPSYQMVMNAANGDPTMFSILANGLLAKATTTGEVRNLTAKSLSNAGTALDLMGVPKNSTIRANFNNTSAQNKLLGATESGLVGGYNTALNTSAAATNSFADLASAAQGVTDALMGLKGFLQTFPNTGSMAGGVSSVVSGAGSMAMQYAMMRSAFGGGGGGARGGGAPIGPVMANGKFASNTGKLLPFLKKAGGSLAVAGTAYQGYQAQKQNQGIAGGLFTSMATGAATGALMGIGTGPGSLVTGSIGALVGGGAYLAGRGFGMGGDNPAENSGTSSKSGMTLQPPVNGPITSGYGDRSAAAKKNPGISSFHRGIDYGVPVGTSVKAAADGVVTETGLHKQYGNYVIIKHGAKSTLYGHLSSIRTRTGAKVKAGQEVALSGGKKGAQGAGTSTGPHLHFEVRSNGGVAAQGRENPSGLFGKLFSNFKSGIVSGINMVKKAVNTVTGKDIFNVSEKEESFNFNQTGNVLNSRGATSIANTMRYAYKSGAPISFADISGGKAGAYNFNAMTPEGKKRVNAEIDPQTTAVSGDTAGIAGGSRAGLIRTLHRAGFRGRALETAFAVALAESGGRATAHNGKAPDDSYGLFQINMIGNLMSERLGKKWRGADGNRFKLSGVNDLYDPMTNAKVAYHMSNKGSNWSAWSTYTGGTFVKFLDDARAAAVKAKIPSYDTGIKRVPEDQLAMVHKDEMILTAAEATKVRNSVSSSGGTANINVTMNVTLANSSAGQAQKLLSEFKKQLQEELKYDKMGMF
jgi:murein DD-endopeptidase MepM/ murein hydrolase activator NlpD